MRDYEFGNHLAALRQECGYSQYQLANLLHVSDKAVSKWETGVAKPRMKTCQKLADVLGIDVSDLFSTSGFTSSTGGSKMNKGLLWKKAENKLCEVYGDEPDLSIINRFRMEKNAFRDTDTIVIFAALACLRDFTQQHHTVINLRGSVNASFTAWLIGASAFNPLPAHSHCPACHKIHFFPDVADGWDLQPSICDCGHIMVRDGHNIPFEVYQSKKALFSGVECNISPAIIHDAWKIILKYVQPDYSCTRYLIKQGEETGFPGEFSKLFLHPRKDDPIYCSIDEVPEVSHSAMLRAIKNPNVPSITLFENKENELTYDRLPEIEELLQSEVIQHAIEKYCHPFVTSGISTFDGYVRLEAAMHDTFIDGCDFKRLAGKMGLKNVSEFPFYREGIWFIMSQAPHFDSGIAEDIMYNIRLGRYANEMPARDNALMRRLGLPEWFPEMASSIRYLFPKAHCVDFAYQHLLMSWCDLQKGTSDADASEQ